MTLGEYVQRTADLPWQWGVQDCTVWAADWCKLRWGIDPAASYRGRYSSEAEALALIAEGLSATVGPHIDLRAKGAPGIGDVGVIEVAGREIAAIWSGAHWLFRTPRGVGMARRAAIKVWGD